MNSLHVSPAVDPCRTSESFEHRVRATVVRVAKIEWDASAEADLFRELGVESRAALELLLSLEDEFQVSILDQEFGEARTLGKLVALMWLYVEARCE